MTADDEVRNIRWTLEKIHKALYEIDNEFEKALPEINNILNKLEQIITNIANEASEIRNTTVQIVSNFPNYTVYFLILLVLEVAAGITALILTYFIIISFNQLYHKQFIPCDKRKNGKLFRKSDEKDMRKFDAKTLIYYSPSSSFASLDIPYDKNDKEWWIEMHHSDNRRFQPEKV